MIIELNNNISLLTEKKERLAIGFFDGLHHGHLKLFGDQIANTSVLTFTNIPSKKNLLYTNKERVNQLKKLGVKNIYVYDVSDNMPAEDFFTNYLDVLDPSEIIVGSDFQLGSDHVSVKELAKRYKVTVIQRDERYSSTKVREAIARADFETANNILIWPYYRKGVVQKNNQVGRQLGFPTANIPIVDNLIQIPSGIYITNGVIFGERYRGSTMVGKPATIKPNSTPFIETHLIGYNDEDFYGEEIKVIFYKWVGEIKRMVNNAALMRRIQKFVKMSEEYKFVKSC